MSDAERAAMAWDKLADGVTESIVLSPEQVSKISKQASEWGYANTEHVWPNSVVMGLVATLNRQLHATSVAEGERASARAERKRLVEQLTTWQQDLEKDWKRAFGSGPHPGLSWGENMEHLRRHLFHVGVYYGISECRDEVLATMEKENSSGCSFEEYAAIERAYNMLEAVSSREVAGQMSAKTTGEVETYLNNKSTAGLVEVVEFIHRAVPMSEENGEFIP